MTMDPRHGELSRAMRNRSIELFMPLKPRAPKLEVLGLSSESTVFRFGAFQAFGWEDLEEAHFVEILAICFDHLTFKDIQICHRWHIQVTSGLYGLSLEKQKNFTFWVKIYQQMMEYNGRTLDCIQKTYESIGGKLDLSPGFGDMQVSAWVDNNWSESIY